MAVTLALEANRENLTLPVLIDSAFGINKLQKHAMDPLSFIHHPHKDLLKLADNIIHTRDTLEYKTHIVNLNHTRESHTTTIQTRLPEALSKDTVNQT